MTNVGKWDGWYANLGDPEPYDDTAMYVLGAEWLAGCDRVEDWGTGRGWFKTLRPDAIGIDGSQTPHADIIADLETYRSTTSGLWMRHVIEHNWAWERILTNAVASFTDRMALCLFTPDGPAVAQLDFVDPGVPDLCIPTPLIDDVLAEAGCDWTCTEYATDTVYGLERLWLISKEAPCE